jgi:hypothetical protein
MTDDDAFVTQRTTLVQVDGFLVAFQRILRECAAGRPPTPADCQRMDELCDATRATLARVIAILDAAPPSPSRRTH